MQKFFIACSPSSTTYPNHAKQPLIHLFLMMRAKIALVALAMAALRVAGMEFHQASVANLNAFNALLQSDDCASTAHLIRPTMEIGYLRPILIDISEIIDNPTRNNNAMQCLLILGSNSLIGFQRYSAYDLMNLTPTSHQRIYLIMLSSYIRLHSDNAEFELIFGSLHYNSHTLLLHFKKLLTATIMPHLRNARFRAIQLLLFYR